MDTWEPFTAVLTVTWLPIALFICCFKSNVSHPSFAFPLLPFSFKCSSMERRSWANMYLTLNFGSISYLWAANGPRYSSLWGLVKYILPIAFWRSIHTRCHFHCFDSLSSADQDGLYLGCRSRTVTPKLLCCPVQCCFFVHPVRFSAVGLYL